MYYKIDPKYSLILKKNYELLIIRENKIKKIKLLETDIKDLEKILTKTYFKEMNSSIFKILLKRKIIIKEPNILSTNNTKSYLETYIGKSINLEQLSNKCIMIIGLGGIGVEIIEHLVGTGINNYILVDYDKVEDSNLNRQYIYKKKDISKSKVEICKEILLSKNPHLNIKTYNKYITNSDDITLILNDTEVDMIICAADTPYLDIRLSILNACIERKIPCIFGGVSIKTGQYGPTLIKKKNMLEYRNLLIKMKENVIKNNINKASFGPTNSMISSYMGLDIVMTLINSPKDIASLNVIREIDFKKRIDYEIKKF